MSDTDVRLILDRLDTVSGDIRSEIHTRISDIGAHLSHRIDELCSRVGTQNGRVGKCEQLIASIEARQEVLHGDGPPGRDGGGSRWWKPSKPLVQGGAGAGLAIALIELAKVVVPAVVGK